MSPFILRSIWLRILVVLALSIVIWWFIAYLNGLLIGEEYSRASHFIIAVMTTILTMFLLQTTLKIDKIQWKHLGHRTFKKNISSFSLGFSLWLIPAAMGTIICLVLGWSEIILNTTINNLLFSILILFITVFLIEALPEEFIFRGYIYRYLNGVFPHWVTILLQSLMFSLFAFSIGAMYSVEQLQFTPGFAIILGVFRSISGTMWISIGFHVGMMTATQILGPVHGHFEVNGMMTLQFFAFILLPSIVGATVLSFIYHNHNWGKIEPLELHK
ncbi:CPBP family intramembrane glutamic endopeptidase [Metabacillus malikii]|uniref:CPBP family intramembrane glutamic endopeptidase n=1 Tax=Metabacillus malikii TaxID=1504265 RepID=UPI0027D8C26B|nr:type II CAAX endopeptidase family protein [Metabacillus malikii]